MPLLPLDISCAAVMQGPATLWHPPGGSTDKGPGSKRMVKARGHRGRLPRELRWAGGWHVVAGMGHKPLWETPEVGPGEAVQDTVSHVSHWWGWCGVSPGSTAL